MAEEEGTIRYNNPSNVEVADSEGVFHRAQLVATAPGEIRFNTPDNSPNVQVADENGVFHRAQLVAMIGGGNVNENRIIVKSDTIPAASESTYGKFYCYSGETNSSYAHGYIYECIADSSVNTSISLHQEDEYEINKLAFDSEHYSIESFFEAIAALSTPTFDPTEVVSGSLVFDHVNELWYVSGSDADGNILFSNFTIEGSGSDRSLDAYGFIYIDHFPDNYPEGYTEDYIITRTEVLSNYHWVRMDVQPAAKLGRYLSTWNCATGLASTNPQESPYEYTTGDYYIVGTVASAGGTNYRPNGSSYVIGQASTTVESSVVTVNDTYLYDGTNWTLLKTGTTVTSVNGQVGDVTVQETLVNQQNIKSINGNSLLGSGDLELIQLVTATATLAVNDWTSNTQTVNVTGVTESNNVIVAPAPASQVDYTSAGIICTSQGAGTLTFTCTTVPSNAITVNVLILK